MVPTPPGGKRALEDHFDQNIELEAALTAKNDNARLALAQVMVSLRWRQDLPQKVLRLPRTLFG